jgi:hypothetical protein
MVADQAWQSPVRDAAQRAWLHALWWSYGFCRMQLRGNRWSDGLIRSEMSEKSSWGMVKSPRRNGSPQWLGSWTKES